MRKTEKRGSPKKTAKNPNHFRSLDLHSVCIRLNQIIERSNAIDNKLSEYEKTITKNRITPISIQEEPISEYGTRSSPESKYQSATTSSSRVSSPTAIFNIDDQQPKLSTVNYNENLNLKTSETSSVQGNQISLNDIYCLMLDLKKQVTEIAKNQLKMQEEIQKLASSNGQLD